MGSVDRAKKRLKFAAHFAKSHPKGSPVKKATSATVTATTNGHKGDKEIGVTDTSGFKVGDSVKIGTGGNAESEKVHSVDRAKKRLKFAAHFAKSHPKGSPVRKAT